jgi:hypothetical protein
MNEDPQRSGSPVVFETIEEMVVAKKHSLAGARTQLVANEHVAVLEYCQIVDGSGISSTY